MDLPSAALVAGAGFGAGIVNTMAGAGSLLTFPTLLATGLSPLAANVSNALGMIPGSISGAYGMRHELAGLRGPVLRLCAGVGVGSLAGAALLLALPSTVFDRVVPLLVALAGLLVLTQPTVVRRAMARGRRDPEAAFSATPVAVSAVGVVGIYSGYFGAAQGVLLIGVLGIATSAVLHRANAVKNLLSIAGNGVAGLVYAVVAPVHWDAVLLLGLGSGAGGPVGAALARRIRPGPLRVGIAVVSLGVAARLAQQSWLGDS